MIDSLKKVVRRMVLFMCASTAVGAGLGGVNVVHAQAMLSTAAAGRVVFVAGTAEHQTSAGVRNAIVKDLRLIQGDTVHTGIDAYVYVRMADAGLLVVRPQSELRIDRWFYDAQHPELSEIKYTLQSGVARYVSGRGSQAAKDKFRFNTSLAAIGVRGTDFSVLARPDLTQVSVKTGAVVVSGLGPGCSVDALGPCEGGGALELLATHRDKLLQISLDDRRPQMIDSVVGGGPDRVRKPAANEPRADAGPASTTKGVFVAELARDTPLINSTEPVAGVSKVPVSIGVWGRWGALASKEAGVTVVQDVLKNRELTSINSYYVLAANALSPMELPGAGIGQFSLASHNGLLVHPQSGAIYETAVTDSSLQINFGTRRFQTSLDLQAAGLKTSIQSQGSFDAGGKMASDPYVSTTALGGLVGGKGGAEAIYIYRRPAEQGIEVSGVASWRK